MTVPMQIAALSIFPELIDAGCEYGIVRRAIERGALQTHCMQLRQYAQNARGDVDDRPFGGGPGMVMTPDALTEGLRHARSAVGSGQPLTICMSPQGQPLTDTLARQLAEQPALVLICGRYEGIDQRVMDADVDLEVSVGDVVLSGGELPAMLLIDALARLLPGVLGDDRSADEDSFSPAAQGLLDHPHYTRPAQHTTGDVPAVLLSGDHGAVTRWRLKQSLGWTWLKRPDLLEQLDLTDSQSALLAEFIAEQGTADSNKKDGATP